MGSTYSILRALGVSALIALAGCAGTQPKDAAAPATSDLRSPRAQQAGRIVMLENGVEPESQPTPEDPYLCVIPYADSVADAALGAVHAPVDAEGYFQLALQPGQYGVYVMHRMGQPAVWTGTSPRVRISVPRASGGEVLAIGEIRIDLQSLSESPGKVGPWTARTTLGPLPGGPSSGNLPVHAAAKKLIASLHGPEAPVYVEGLDAETTPPGCLVSGYAAAIADMPIKGTTRASSPGSSTAGRIVAAIILLPVLLVMCALSGYAGCF